MSHPPPFASALPRPDQAADDAEWSQVGDPRYANLADAEMPRTECLKAVSYTHLTLPTILLV